MLCMNVLIDMGTITMIVFFLSFSERGRVFIRNEVWAFQIGPSGLVFTGDGKGELKVWRWASQIP